MEIEITKGMLWFIAIATIWTIPWKGYSLWLAAQRSHKKWFIVLLVVNTLAILEIYYIFFVARKSVEQQQSSIQE